MGLQTLKIDTAASGDNTIVAAVSGQKVRLYEWHLTAAGAVTVTWKDGASTTLTGAMSLATGVPNDSPAGAPQGSQMPIFTTTAGNALILNLGTAVQVSGFVVVAQY